MFASLHERLFGTSEPVTLGRFEMGRRLGAGAMGVVCEARDPDLERKVALKVLRADALDPAVVERLMLEARALAKLRHPNVVTVYEVGKDGSNRFIVMDLVDGGTLRTWLSTARDWREIVGMFVQAGRGLAAAHAADLIHRDFKPDNVLVEDGQARVVDFGLAAGTDLEATMPEFDGPTLSSDVRLTQTGAFVGTPAYMAPEQFSGEATPASDQYAFCVALFEALHGARPFTDGPLDRIDGILAARRTSLPSGAPKDAPSRLRKVIARGLAYHARDRWPDMQTLLRALERASAKPWRRPALIVGAVSLGLAAGAGATRIMTAAPSCAQVLDPLREAWTEERRAGLLEAFKQTERPYAVPTWQRTETLIDDYATAWGDARLQVCEAARTGASGDAVLLPVRAECLERQLDAFEALLDSLGAPLEDRIDRAVDAAASLPRPDACDDEEQLRRQLARRATAPTADDDAYQRLAEVAAANQLGDYRRGAELAASLRAHAEDVGDLALAARTLGLLAAIAEQDSNLELAEGHAKRGVEHAETLGDPMIRLDAQLRLLSVLVRRDAKEEKRARDIIRVARATLTHVGMPRREHARLLRLEIAVDNRTGKFDDALAGATEMTALLESSPDSSPTDLATAYNAQSRVFQRMGRYEAAIQARRKALQTFEDKLGPDTPRAIRARMGLAETLHNLDRADEALKEGRRAVEAADRVLGPDTNLAARARGVLAIASAGAGLLSDSERLFRESATTLEAVLGNDDQDVADVWMNLARVLTGLDRPLESLEALERAGTIYDRALPEDHPTRIYFHTNLSEALAKVKRFPEALASAQRAVEISKKRYAPHSPKTARTSVVLGVALVGVGRGTDAIAVLDAAVADLVAAESPAAVIAEARFELAKAQLSVGKTTMATRSAETARAELTSFGKHRQRIETIDAWLADVARRR